ncbi:MAG: DivIVA domain-containing protein [Oscillospiraceae bacterium]|nr:DivIVA domain-containing protein [Oscillospiraceae bacterium]
MLTPREITDKVFVKAVFGGYDMTGVDDFLESVSTDYKALYDENAILKGKLKILVEKVEEYRSTEDAMRMALLTAQRMGEEITVEANKQKEETLKSADEEAKSRLAEISQRVADEELRLTVAAKETAKFIQLSQAVMQKHSEFLTKLETARRAVRPDPPPIPPTQEEQIADVAEQIDSAVGKLTASGAPAPPPNVPAPLREQPQEDEEVPQESPNESPPSQYDDEGEPTRLFGEEGESAPSITPRPRFDFDDLKFGANFDKGNND